MNLQLIATVIITVAAAVWFVRTVFFGKKGGCDSCGHKNDCPGCRKADGRCKNCDKHTPKQ